MKVTIMQQIQLKDFQKGWRSITKEFETNIIPHKGDFITDSVWKDPFEYEVVEVNINYQEDECYISLSAIILETNDKDRLRGYIEMTKLHNWKCAVDV